MLVNDGRCRIGPLVVAALLAAQASGCALLERRGSSRDGGNVDLASAKKIVPVLQQSLKDEDPEARFKAVQALESMGSAAEDAIPALVDLLEDPEERVRSAAGAALVKLGPSAAWELAGRVREGFAPARARALVLLARMGPQAKGALSAVRDAAKDQDPRIRAKASEALAAIDPSGFSAREGSPPPPLEETWEPPDEVVPAGGADSWADKAPAAEEKPAPEPVEPVPVRRLVESLSSGEVDTRVRAVRAVDVAGAAAGEALPVLVHVALNDIDVNVRYAAAMKLGEMGAAPAPALVLALSHSEPHVRSNAVEALAGIGPVTDDVIPSVIRALRDPPVRSRAVLALAKFGEKSIPALKASLGDDEIYSSVRRAFVKIDEPAARALSKALDDGSIGRRAEDVLAAMGEPAVPIVIEGFPSGAVEARTRVLVRIGRPAIPALIEGLGDKRDSVRRSCGLTLCELGPEAVDALPALIEMISRNSSEAESYALWRFGRSGVPDLARAASSEDEVIRLMAVRSLSGIRPRPAGAYPVLIDALNDPDSWVVDAAAESFREAGPAAVPPLLRAVQHHRPETRRAAVRALGLCRPSPKKVLEPLKTALRDSDVEVSRLAAAALGSMGADAKGASRELIRTLGDDGVRWWSTQALRRIGRGARPALERAMKREIGAVRFRAACLLSELDPEASGLSEALVGALQVEDAGLRYQAASALSRVPPTAEVVDVLMRALGDEDPGVRFAAGYALAEAGPRVVPGLLKAASRADAGGRSASRALDMLDASAAPALVEALSDLEMREPALGALVRIGPRAVPVLIRSLHEERLAGPITAVLAEIGRPAVPALRHALREGNDAVKEASAVVLERIEGKP